MGHYVQTMIADHDFRQTGSATRRRTGVSPSGGSSEEATEAVPPQIKLNKKKIKNIIFN
jgi:hypothetical protein